MLKFRCRPLMTLPSCHYKTLLALKIQARNPFTFCEKKIHHKPLSKLENSGLEFFASFNHDLKITKTNTTFRSDRSRTRKVQTVPYLHHPFPSTQKCTKPIRWQISRLLNDKMEFHQLLLVTIEYRLQ